MRNWKDSRPNSTCVNTTRTSLATRCWFGARLTSWPRINQAGANMLRVLFVLLPLVTDCDTAPFEGSNYSRAKGLGRLGGLTLTDLNSPLVTLRLGEWPVAGAEIRATSPMEWKVARPSLRPQSRSQRHLQPARRFPRPFHRRRFRRLAHRAPHRQRSSSPCSSPHRSLVSSSRS